MGHWIGQLKGEAALPAGRTLDIFQLMILIPMELGPLLVLFHELLNMRTTISVWPKSRKDLAILQMPRNI